MKEYTPKELKEFCYTPIQYFQTSSAEKSNNTFYNTAISTLTKPDNGEAYFISLQNQRWSLALNIVSQWKNSFKSDMLPFVKSILFSENLLFT